MLSLKISPIQNTDTHTKKKHDEFNPCEKTTGYPHQNINNPELLVSESCLVNHIKMQISNQHRPGPKQIKENNLVHWGKYEL